MNSRLPIRLTLLVCAASMLAAPPTPAGAAQPVFGRWLTHDKAAIVAIGSCGAKLCGRIERILDPKAPPNDARNPDRRLRGRPLVGTLVLSDFTRSGRTWKSGRAYDPKSGSTYPSELRLLDDGRLQVTGCVLFVCKSRYWKRAS